jgi:hypothetical protein
MEMEEEEEEEEELCRAAPQQLRLNIRGSSTRR